MEASVKQVDENLMESESKSRLVLHKLEVFQRQNDDFQEKMKLLTTIIDNSALSKEEIKVLIDTSSNAIGGEFFAAYRRLSKIQGLETVLGEGSVFGRQRLDLP
jgi:endonuclease IV